MLSMGILSPAQISKFKNAQHFLLCIFQSTGNLSCLMTKPTKWHVRPAKTQISLGICPVWSVFAVRMKKAWMLSYPMSTQWRLWSDWADARLIWVFAGCTVILLVLSWLIWCSSWKFESQPNTVEKWTNLYLDKLYIHLSLVMISDCLITEPR